MAFDDTILPNFVIADLYKNSLIEPSLNEFVISEKNDNKSGIRFLGENKKNIAIIVQDDEAVFIGEEKLQLLSNLLTACKLNLADVAIVNIGNKNTSYKQIKEEIEPQFLLLMGINSKAFQLPLIFPEYKIQQYDNCKMLIATDLNNLLGNSNDVKMEKSKLWLCLKQLFAI